MYPIHISCTRLEREFAFISVLSIFCRIYKCDEYKLTVLFLMQNLGTSKGEDDRRIQRYTFIYYSVLFLFQSKALYQI